MSEAHPPRTRFHYAWKKKDWKTADRSRWHTGVALHGHTWYSHESLGFLPDAARHLYTLPMLLKWAEKRYRRKWHGEIDYEQGYWTSPVSPDAARALESRQIEEAGFAPLVSLTDHNEIGGCLDIISLEWSAPFSGATFHIGVHNMPRTEAPRLMEMLLHATTHPDDTKTVPEALAALSAFPETLVVVNHPFVNEGRIGRSMHASLVRSFIARHQPFVHALEVNALQPWHVNRRAVAIAEESGLPLVAGGDRHAFDPSGAINLAAADTMGGFVRMIREEKRNDILFMPQYHRSLMMRYARSVEAIMADYPALGDRAHWYDRTFLVCPDGATRSLAQMTGGRRSPVIRRVNMLLGAWGFVTRLTTPASASARPARQ